MNYIKRDLDTNRCGHLYASGAVCNQYAESDRSGLDDMTAADGCRFFSCIFRAAENRVSA